MGGPHAAAQQVRAEGTESLPRPASPANTRIGVAHLESEPHHPGAQQLTTKRVIVRAWSILQQSRTGRKNNCSRSEDIVQHDDGNNVNNADSDSSSHRTLQHDNG